MNGSRILAVARRIAQGFRRDERTLGLMFVVPIAVTALLGWVIREPSQAIVRLVVVNEAGAAGQRLVDALTEVTTNAPDGIELIATADDEAAAEAMLRDDRAEIALRIPPELLEVILAGERPTFTIITEGSDPGADGAAFGALQGLFGTIAAELRPPGSTTGPIVPIVEHRTIFLDTDADELDVLAPVFLGYFAYFFVFLLTGISFLRERVGGTLERLLATPVTRAEIVLGYSLGFGIFATIQVIALTAFILASIDVPAIGPLPAFSIGLDVGSAGSPLLAFAITLLLSLGAVSLGVFLSTFARNELQIIQFIPLVIIPQGLLGGIFWPIENLPEILRGVAAFLPMSYAIDGLREVMVRGADLTSAAVQLDLAVLAGIAVVFVVLAAGTIKREVA